MSKLLLGVVSGTALWTIGMGVGAVTGGFGGPQSEALSSDFTGFRLPSSRDIKQKYKDFWCANYLFEDVFWNSNGSDSNSITNNGIKSCISVWWEKEIYDDGKWMGSWNLLWGIRDNSYGEVYVYNIKAENGEIKRDPASYPLKWDQTSNKWLNGVETSYNENNSIIPNTELIEKSNGWDFEVETEKICSSSNPCTSNSPQKTFVNLNWEFVSGEKPVYEWIKNIDQITSISKMKNRLSQIKGFFKLLQNQKPKI